MRLGAGPAAFAVNAFEHIFEAVEHKAAGAYCRVKKSRLESGCSQSDHELPDVVGGAMQADVFSAAGFRECRFDGVAQQIGLQQPIAVEFSDQPDDLGHVAASHVVGEVGVAENLLDQNQLILHLGGEIALPDFARLAQDMCIEGKKARVERSQDLVIGQAQQ